MRRFEIDAFFLDHEHGALFCIHYIPVLSSSNGHGKDETRHARSLTPAPPLPKSEGYGSLLCEFHVKGSILYLHPFAEEMHKSRRMAALQARRFAEQGYAVLQVDLTGCGDSTGDFSEATLDIWLNDARRAHAWLAAHTTGPISLWGLRSGASLAVRLACTLPDIEQLLLWQPTGSGELFLNQFLRIRLASDMLNGTQTHTGTTALRAQLAAGEAIEVGGYGLNPAMAQQLIELKLAEHTPPCPVFWLELGMQDAEAVSPASQRIVESWRRAGVTVQTLTLAGEPFWLTQEITECPALIEATTL